MDRSQPRAGYGKPSPQEWSISRKIHTTDPSPHLSPHHTEVRTGQISIVSSLGRIAEHTDDNALMWQFEGHFEPIPAPATDRVGPTISFSCRGMPYYPCGISTYPVSSAIASILSAPYQQLCGSPGPFPVCAAAHPLLHGCWPDRRDRESAVPD